MHVAFWAASQDGSSWYRADLPALALSWLGHRTWASQILPATQRAAADVIVGCRVAQPGALDTWRDLKASGKRLVVDLDDDYLHTDPTDRRAHAFWSSPDVRARLLEAVSLADRVTVVSDALAEVVREHHPDVRVVPNGLHARVLSPHRNYRPDVLVAGWAGTGSTAAGLGMVARALTRICRYTPPAGAWCQEVRVATVGVDHATVDRAGLPADRVHVTEWAPPGDEYLAHLGAFDVLLAGYPDTEFNQAKFPTKALEAGMLGIPLIVSDIRPYREAITHGVNGFLIREPHEWGKYLKMLVDDPYLRELMGSAARSSASRYVLQSTALQWEGAITR